MLDDELKIILYNINAYNSNNLKGWEYLWL